MNAPHENKSIETETETETIEQQKIYITFIHQ